MENMGLLVIMLGVGIGAYVLFMVAVPKATPEDKTTKVKNALDRLYTETRVQEDNQYASDGMEDEPALVRTIFGLPFMQPLKDAAIQGGYQQNLKQVLLMVLMFSAGTLLAFILLGNPTAGLALVLPFGYLLPLRHCKGKVRKRNRAFIDKFPDALDMITRSVRSGFPLSIALQMLSDNAEEPVKSEFRQVADDVALGRTLAQALSRLSHRINEPDVRFFVVVLSVQQETGGNLSEIIGNLSTVIRKRKQLRHRIKAMTSEGKATGFILGGLPVFVFTILWFIQPGYLDPLFTDPLGQMIGIGVLVMLGVCFFVVKQMINIDI